MGNSQLTPSKLAAYPEWDLSIAQMKLISKADGSEVYRVETGKGEIRYVRTVTEELVGNIREIQSLKEPIGLPPISVYSGNIPIIIMQPAPGDPLSRVLPVSLLPIVWKFKRSSLKQAFRQIGGQLGRLHKLTKYGCQPAIETPSFNKYISQSYNFEDQFDESISTEIQLVKDAVRDVPLQCGRIFTDRTPHNIFYDGSNITHIDFTFNRDAIIQDVLTTERAIELAVSRLPYGRDVHLTQLTQAFRQGYQSGYPEYELPDIITKLQIIMDCYLLSWYQSTAGHKIGARLTKNSDISLLKSRIITSLEECHGSNK